MHWLAKAALHKAVSVLPRAESANYLLQRHVTKTLPASERSFRRKFGRALIHVDAYARHGPPRALGDAVFYEFGVGWDLTIPLAYWALGVDRQVLVDLRPHLRAELVAATLTRFQELGPELEEEAGRPLRDPGTDVRLDRLAEHFGIEYLAPRDARRTGLEAGSVDFVTSTSTLEHVPAQDVLPLLAECRRVLAAHGAMSSVIDLRDHFSYFDRGLSPYNFLRYSDRTWRLVDSGLAHQNRLRSSNYQPLFEAAGLTVVSKRGKLPRRKKLEPPQGSDLAPRFRGYRPEDLAVIRLDVVARPADGLPDAVQEVGDLGG
ncbi:MAG: class I SAM-dependent methyltransferase [Gaiellaceae bacterium]